MHFFYMSTTVSMGNRGLLPPFLQPQLTLIDSLCPSITAWFPQEHSHRYLVLLPFWAILFKTEVIELLSRMINLLAATTTCFIACI